MKRNGPFIAIQEDENIRIPKEYHRINDIIAIIYDQLTEIYILDNYKSLFKTTVKFKDVETELNKFKNSNDNILDWLANNDYKPELEVLLTKRISIDLINEFIGYIFESLYSAKRGKWSVAFSLIRKPFCDILLLLEDIYTNQSNFIDRFFHDGNPAKYDPSRIKNKLEVVELSVEKLNKSGLFYSELIHGLRYDKEFLYGINAFSNQALHIVTNDKNYRTTDQNFNFIFSNEEDYLEYSYHYYNSVPYLLIYSTSVIDGIIFKFLTDEPNQKLATVKEFRRLISLIFVLDITKKADKNLVHSFFKLIYINFQIICTECGTKKRMKRRDCNHFLETEEIPCNKCSFNLIGLEDTILTIRNLLDDVFNHHQN